MSPATRCAGLLRRQTAQAPRPPGVLRLGDHRRRRRRADRRHLPTLLPGRRADADGPLSGDGVQGRTRTGRRADRLRPHVLRHVRVRDRVRFAPARGDRAKVDRDRGVRPRRRPSRRRRSAAGRDRQALGPRRRPHRRRDRRRAATAADRAPLRAADASRPSSIPSAPADRRRAARRARPARRAGPADQPASRRRARRQISVSLYGEVQKEVIEATLAADFGVDVTFSETTTICIERPIGVRRGGRVDRRATDNPFLATVGLRVDPAPLGSRRDVPSSRSSWARCRRRSSTRCEETVPTTLRQGLLGWQVTDCVVTMTHSGYCAAAEPRPRHLRQEHVEHRPDFRSLTPLVLMDALRRAGTVGAASRSTGSRSRSRRTRSISSCHCWRDSRRRRTRPRRTAPRRAARRHPSRAPARACAGTCHR